MPDRLGRVEDPTFASDTGRADKRKAKSISQADTASTSDEQSGESKTATTAIMQVLPALESGGVERGTLEMADAILAKGWHSLVVSEGGSMQSALERKGSSHITLPISSKNPFAILRNSRKLARIIKKENISLVHARSRAPAWAAMLAARRCNVPFVTTFHGMYSGSAFPLKRWYNSIMTKGDRVIAISEFVARHIYDHYRTDPKKLTIIHRGVDLTTFDPEAISQHRIVALANQWRIPDDLPIIFMPGRLTRWKGQMELIRALSMLDTRHFFCIIAGHEGSHRKYRHELEDAIMQRDLGSNVRIVDATRDMPAAYLLSHVIVVPSTRPEAFGRIAPEAGAMGKPVIAFGHGGALETVQDGRTGWLVQPGNVPKLSEAINESLTISDARYRQLSEAARLYAREQFALDKMRNQTLAVYQSLLQTA